jgi:hypothetical protein
MLVAERDGVVLRHATDDDLPRVDEITVMRYRPIFESYVAMLGEECYRAVRHDPELTWEQRKTGQVHRLYQEHPDRLWVLEKRSLHLWTRVWTMHTQRHDGRMRQWDSTARYRSLSTGKIWNNTIPVRNRRNEGIATPGDAGSGHERAIV